MMETAEYFERILGKYKRMFDIYRDYSIGGERFSAYGYFSSYGEKYVFSKNINLWSIHSYEHVLFTEMEVCTREKLDQLQQVITEYVEPQMVRKGKRYPEQNHMYSYITFVILCRQEPMPEIVRRIRHYKYEKGYLMNFRGHSEGHLICVDLENEKVYTNRAAANMKKMYSNLFSEKQDEKDEERDAFEQVN